MHDADVMMACVCSYVHVCVGRLVRRSHSFVSVYNNSTVVGAKRMFRAFLNCCSEILYDTTYHRSRKLNVLKDSMKTSVRRQINGDNNGICVCACFKCYIRMVTIIRKKNQYKKGR